MYFKLSSVWLAVLGAIIVNCIPIAPQQALTEVQHGETDVELLIAYIVQSNRNAAQIEYATVQHQLDGLGMYLGQIIDTTCVSTGPGDNTTSAASEVGVITALQSLQLDLIDISAGIINSNDGAAISAWEAAQQALDSTYAYVFR